MNILFTICGRAGSKGLKNKNLLSLNNQPLIYYAYSLIDLYIVGHPENHVDIVISSDSNDLHDLSKKIKLKIQNIHRPLSLCEDDTPKVPVIRHAYNTMKSNTNNDYDIVIDLDITSPIRRLSDLENIIKNYLSKKCDVAFTVTESRRNPFFNMVKSQNSGYYDRVIKSNLTNRQSAPEIYDMNASIYIYNPLFLEHARSVFDGKCSISIMDDNAVLDIDSVKDWEMLNIISEYLLIHDEDWKCVYSNIKNIQ